MSELVETNQAEDENVFWKSIEMSTKVEVQISGKCCLAF